MPYKNREDRQAWETCPEQRAAAKERQERAREKREDFLRLVSVWEIWQRCGHWGFCGPGLRAKVEIREDEIRRHVEKRNAEKVRMEVVRVRDI
jgi:hypothetical protein